MRQERKDGSEMENKEELINCLKEREEYLEGEWYQLADLVDKMGGLDVLEADESRDAKDLLTALSAIWKAFTATQKALRTVRRMIDRNK